MKSLSCRDAGFDCDYVMQADNDYEIFKKSEKHVFNAHGIKTVEFIPTFNEKIRGLIRDNA